LLTLSAVIGVAVTFSLGVWQWGRAHEKLALQAQQQARQALPALGQDTLRIVPRAPDLLHRTVNLRGQWLATHTVYLDNRQMQARVGFYVITPLRLSPGQVGEPDAVVLVQRGWVPRSFTDRQQLPAITTPAGEVTVVGRIAPAPSKLYAFDGADTGSIRQNLDLPAFSAETGLPLVEGSVQQTGAPSEGLLRDWPVPASSADKNYGYAFQWWALCGVIFLLYVWFQFIAPRRRPA
jgi:surfeit locus 1 family protein